MNPETTKPLIWAAMHNPDFAKIRFEPFIDFSAYATDRRAGFSIAINKVQVTVPSAIAWEYGLSRPEKPIIPAMQPFELKD